MRIYPRSLLISTAASVLLCGPFFVYYRLPAKEVFGFIFTFAMLGPLVMFGYRAKVRDPSEEWSYFLTLFPPALALVMQAIVAPAMRYLDTGTLLKAFQSHMIVIAAGVVAFGILIFLPARLVRSQKRPNKAPEPTPGLVTPRALE